MLMVIPLTSECRVIYNMENMIGRGHYGTVYKGHLEFNDKDQPREQVAIKMLNTMQVSTDFHREIGIMRTLSHPNIVKFKYWAEKSHCIIMEYLQSGSFDIYLRFTAPNLNNPRLVSFALDIANVSGSTKRFSHHDIFSRLNTIKAEILPNYMPPPEIATSKLSRRKQRYEIGIHFIFYFFFQMELETRP